MRTQSAGKQVVLTIGFEDQFLGDGLSMWIVGEPVAGVRRGFVDSALIVAGKGHAGTAGEDQSPDASVAAAADHVLGSHDVRIVVVLPRSPNSGDGGDVKDGFHIAAGALYIGQLANVAVQALDADRFERRRRAAHEGSDAVAASDERLEDVLAEETAGAGNEAGQLTLAGCCGPVLVFALESSSGSGSRKGCMPSSVLGPMPRTRRSSDRSRKGPRSWRSATMRLASCSPMLGIRVSSGQSARLTSILKSMAMGSARSMSIRRPRSWPCQIHQPAMMRSEMAISAAATA